MIVDISTSFIRIPVSFIPFLIIKLFVMMVSWVDREMVSYPSRQFQLLVHLVQQEIVLLGEHTVTVSAVFSKDLES